MMRKAISVILLILAFVMVLLSEKDSDAASVKQDDFSSLKFDKTEYNLVFIPKLVHEWYEDVRKGVDTAIKELAEKGITVKYSWDPPADAIVTDQIAKIEAAAARRPDGISIAVIDPSATNAVINELNAAGIRISTFDNDAPASTRNYYCGHSKNYEDGKEIAERLAARLGEKGEVAVLAGSLAAINHQERVNGFVDGIGQYPNMKIVDSKADDDSIEVALSVTEGYLTAYPNLKAVFGCNAASPIGAARAIKDSTKAGDIIVVGMAENDEAMQLVKEGVIFCTLKQQVPTYGYNSVYNMLLIADGKKPLVVQDEIPAVFVTSENVKDFM
jgi:ribose transport system substrate-binding protein